MENINSNNNCKKNIKELQSDYYNQKKRAKNRNKLNSNYEKAHRNIIYCKNFIENPIDDYMQIYWE
jgi:hypothetical protein